MLIFNIWKIKVHNETDFYDVEIFLESLKIIKNHQDYLVRFHKIVLFP